MIQEKRHRLRREEYVGAKTVAFTTRLRDGSRIFEVERAASDFGAILVQEAARQDGDLLLACFMPDHVHALLRGRTETSDLLAAFDRFKLRTGVLLDRFYRPARWQKDCYDHVVRCGDDWQRQAMYSALNPVRAGLVEDALDSPCSPRPLALRGRSWSRSSGRIRVFRTRARGHPAATDSAGRIGLPRARARARVRHG